MEGKIKWYSGQKGYGFISGEDGKDYFVHHTQVPQELRLREGDAITFEAADTDKGLQAHNVRTVGGAAPAKKPAKESEDDGDDAQDDDFDDESDE